MSEHYILEGHTAVPCDLMTWARWFEKADRHVALDRLQVNGKTIKVSTVFLGLDHSFGEGPPLLFETMIFGGKHDQYQEQYSTWDQAIVGHELAIALFRELVAPQALGETP